MPEHRLKVCERSSRRQKCIFSSGDFDSAQSPCYIYYYSRCLSLSKAEVHFFIWWFRQAQSPCYFRCLSLSKAHSYSSSCDFDSAQSPCYFRCLSLSKAHSHSYSRWFRQAQSPCYFRCLSLSKAHSHSYSLWFRLRSITVLLSVPEPVEGRFLFLPVISTSSITVLLPVPELVEGTFLFSSLWFRLRSITVLYLLLLSVPEHRLKVCERSSRRHILTHPPCDFGSAQSTCCFRCLSLSKAHFSILICIIFW